MNGSSRETKPILFGVYLDHPQRVLGGLYHCTEVHRKRHDVVGRRRQGRGQYITFGGLEPQSSRAREREPTLGSGGRAPNGSSWGTAPGGELEGKGPPPEAESSVAFEGPAEEPNLTLLPAL